jgi:hypothetical protein
VLEENILGQATPISKEGKKLEKVPLGLYKDKNIQNKMNCSIIKRDVGREEDPRAH